jgi:hypothetical protein
MPHDADMCEHPPQRQTDAFSAAMACKKEQELISLIPGQILNSPAAIFISEHY